MTGPGTVGPNGGGPAGAWPNRAGYGGGHDPEAVLSQALRAKAGGRRTELRTGRSGSSRLHQLTVAQILLIAAIVGVVLGMAAGIVTLLIG